MISSEFTSRLQQAFTAPQLLLAEADTAAYLANASGFQRRVTAVVKATTADEIRLVLKLAEEHSQTLYPISQGRNWGLGSKVPTRNDAVILDLSGMKRIREVNAEFGYAVVEPGVTQGELAAVLKARNLPFFLDVTGSGAETSVVGNILERGVAYNSLRVESLLGLEVILPDGELVATGFGHYTNAATRHLYPYGVGPDATGLFLQSNFGIVTAATIALVPKPETQCSFILNLRDEAALGKLIEALRGEERRGLLNCVVHIGNTRRRLTAAAPVVFDYFQKRGEPITRERAEEIVGRHLKGAWSAIGTLKGPSELLRVKKRLLRKALRPFGKILFLDERKLKLAKKLAATLRLKGLAAFLEVAESAYGMTCGVPTNNTLKSVYWPAANAVHAPHEPDRGPAGILFVLPILPMAAAPVEAALALVNRVLSDHGFTAGITLNMLHDKSLEGVVSFDFEPEAATKAHACLRLLVAGLCEAGFPPYRLDIDNMDLLIADDDPYWAMLAKFKDALDPNHVLAPGRYARS